ncbi:MAG TPA: hypothetical protein VHA52_10370, partial [Candidatus Babeliaceae bacterium]|nr:hypothetical protein [Candidatus Babeliaceae bacterium]
MKNFLISSFHNTHTQIEKFHFEKFHELSLLHGVDAFLNLGLLSLHHILVRAYLGSHFHAQLGILLSLLYLTVSIGNFGLDLCLPPFLKHISSEQKAAKRFLYTIIVQWLLFGTLLMLIYMLFYILIPFFYKINIINIINSEAASSPLPLPLSLVTEQTIALYLIFAIISESIKKTSKIFLQLTLHTTLALIIDSLGIALYMAIFWTAYNLKYSLPLSFSIILLGLISCIQIALFIPFIYRWYKKLPDNIITNKAIAYPLGHKKNLKQKKHQKNIKQHFYANGNTTGNNEILSKTMSEFIKNRVILALHQSTTQLCSFNVIIPYLAYSLPANHISLYKVLSSITQWISTVFYKTFALSTSIILANTMQSRSSRITLFRKICKRFLFVIIFLVAIGLYILYGHTLTGLTKITFKILDATAGATIHTEIIYLVTILAISFTDGLIVLHEKWHCAEKKTTFLCSTMLITAI